MCGNTFFTHWRLASYWNSIELVIENLKSFWVWIGLNCIFSFWDTSEVNFNGKKTLKWLAIPSDWSLKIQNEIPPPLCVWIGLNCIFSLRDTLERDFKVMKTEKWLSRSASRPSACEKRITIHISSLAAPATGSSIFTRLKHYENHT